LKKTRRPSGNLTSPRTGTCSRARALPVSRNAKDRNTEPRREKPGFWFSGQAAQEIGEQPAGGEWLLQRREMAGWGNHATLGTGDEPRHGLRRCRRRHLVILAHHDERRNPHRAERVGRIG